MNANNSWSFRNTVKQISRNNWTRREGRQVHFVCIIPFPVSYCFAPRRNSQLERFPFARKGRMGWTTTFSSFFEHCPKVLISKDESYRTHYEQGIKAGAIVSSCTVGVMAADKANGQHSHPTPLQILPARDSGIWIHWCQPPESFPTPSTCPSPQA